MPLEGGAGQPCLYAGTNSVIKSKLNLQLNIPAGPSKGECSMIEPHPPSSPIISYTIKINNENY